jgi:hypothetical protein
LLAKELAPRRGRYVEGFVPWTSEYVRCSFTSIAARSPGGRHRKLRPQLVPFLSAVPA